MKINNDFVTNSSSTSFVIAYRPCKGNTTLEARYSKLLEFALDMESWGGTTVGLRATNEKELEEVFLERFCGYGGHEDLAEDPWIREQYEKSLEYIKSGFQIVLKDISYFEKCAETFKEIAKDNEDFIIIATD